MAIKLIIWDLDDTLWAGTLAEGDEVVLNETRAGFIRALNRHGVISAVCSKNDLERARSKLTELGLWEETVFNRIAFLPKGSAVKEMIEDMQLRPANVLFVDDNVLNLEEVKHFCPEIETVNALAPECDTRLAEILESVTHVNKSRLVEYRGLEQRKLERAAIAGSNEDFLRACDIRVAVPRRGDNLVFAGRIEELINRSNQMNFTKSRVPEASLSEAITGYYQEFDCRSLFVWDKFGYHGLVGFAAVQGGTKLLHLTFSCRIMNMGIENWFLWMLKKPDQFPKLDISALPFKPAESKWVKWERYDGEVRQTILKRETKRTPANPTVRIIANCQSAAIAHYANLNDVADIDQFPLGFELQHLLGSGGRMKGNFPNHFVYFTSTDYSNTAWPWNKWKDESFQACATKFCDIMAATGRNVLLILSPERGQPQLEFGVSAERVRACNEVWRALAHRHGHNFHILELETMATEDDLIDIRHYKAPMMMQIGQEVARWYEATQPALAAAE